ncbi:uncharacterized protein LOC134541412 isoform X2 [Bacillus rossius redtenbacheri]|uniref:uncharacterized protein LOC134541412 isoform X2 n=1 Tax=Bacillus rossius redtenbacheri TaxID=93214 RepID=UPI002FDECABD
MDDIQSWWEVPSIAHFCSLFRAAFNLLDFDIEELEEALLTDGTEDCGSSLLQELIVRLLCGCLGNNDISTFNYQMYLRRLFRKKCQEYKRDNPFNTDMDFQFLPLRTKVEILHALCDFRLDGDDVQDLLKNLESDSLRVEPLGHDENDSAYWYFYGTRLYREDLPKNKRAKDKDKDKDKRRKGRDERRRRRHDSEAEDGAGPGAGGAWQVVCFTQDDWDQVTGGFKDSAAKCERSLYHTLAEDFLPEIPRLFAEKERLQRKRLLECQPRRQSSRLEKLKQQRGEGEKEGKIQLPKEREDNVRQDKSGRLQPAEERERRSRTDSECGSVGSPGDSLGDDRSNRSAFIGRQTNNSLSSATGQIVIQGQRRKLRSSQVFQQTVEDLQTGLYKVLGHLKSRKYAWPFAEPVEEEYAPRYYSIISRPMDLRSMEARLDRGRYRTFADFRADFQLIVDNCRQYNGTDNEYTEMVGKLQEAFQYAVDRYLESDPSSDEEVAVEFPSAVSETLTPPHKHQARRRTKSPSLAPDSPRSSSRPGSPRSAPSEPAPAPAPTPTPEARPGAGGEEAGAKRRRMGHGIIENAAAIEALELATEQTLKDINKWLDDTPRFSEFSSASNSPSHFIASEEYEAAGGRVESECRRAQKLERLARPHREQKDVNKRRVMKDPAKHQRRREIQRTIERLQPGKSKGNLIGSIQSANKASDENGLLGKGKDKGNSLITKTDEATPKLSLGTVLTSDVLAFGVERHNFDDEPKDEKIKPEVSSDKVFGVIGVVPKAVSPKPQPFDLLIAKGKKEDSKSEKVASKETKQAKPAPDLSVWFKAFGIPKTTPVAKKKTEVVAPEPEPPKMEDKKCEKMACPGQARDVPERGGQACEAGKAATEEGKVSCSPGSRQGTEEPCSPVGQPLTHQTTPRQRRLSTGSSMSERSSFSQDMMDPLDGSSPRLSLDERLGGYPAPPYPSPLPSPRGEDVPKPLPYPPVNGTIRAGFYKDTSSNLQKNSPEKSNSNSPNDRAPASPFPSYTPRAYPPSHDPGGFQPYRSQAPSPGYDSVSPYGVSPAMQYYDTTKSLTEQYRAARSQTVDEYFPPVSSGLANQPASDVSSPRVTLVQKSQASMFPVKKRPCTEIEPGNDAGKLSPSLRISPKHQQDSQERLNQTSVINMADPPMVGKTRMGSPLAHVSHIQSGPADHSSPPLHYTSCSIMSGGRIVDSTENTPVPFDASQKPERLHLGNLPSITVSSRIHPSPSAVYSPPVTSDRAHQALDPPQHGSASKMGSSTLPDTHSSGKLVPQARATSPQAGLGTSPGVSSERHSTGHDPAGFHRSPFSPQLPASLTLNSSLGLRGNLSNIPRISDRFAADEHILPGAQFSHMFTQSQQQAPVSTSLGMFSQPASSSPYPLLSGKVSDMQATFTRAVQDIAPMLTTKTTAASNLPSVYGGNVTDLSIPNKAPSLSVPTSFGRAGPEITSALPVKDMPSTEMQKTYNHPSADLLASKGSVAQGYSKPPTNLSVVPTKTVPSDVTSHPKVARKRKSKQAASSEAAVGTGQTAFQQYVGGKASAEASPIALKSSSIVPGSAFNFGPAASALGLYAEKEGFPAYLEEYRTPSPSYYLGSKAPRDKAAGAGSQYLFLGHPQAQPPAYPFMSHPQGLVDSAGYQQYLQRRQEELLRNPLMLPQGLLPPAAGYPAGYHPALSIRQPFDRHSWL